jgi:hypothetical protein
MSYLWDKDWREKATAEREERIRAEELAKQSKSAIRRKENGQNMNNLRRSLNLNP